MTRRMARARTAGSVCTNSSTTTGHPPFNSVQLDTLPGSSAYQTANVPVRMSLSVIKCWLTAMPPPSCRWPQTGPKPAAVTSRSNHDRHQPWPQYQPCKCSGLQAVCGPSCACAASKNFCEQWCRCGPACTNRHPGCACTSNCTSNCPCFLAGRECNPHKCHGCTPTALGLVRDGDRVCQNLNITVGVVRRLVIGLSSIAGWGCFVLEDIGKGDYLVCSVSLCASTCHTQLSLFMHRLLPVQCKCLHLMPRPPSITC
jgi:hypothetical protein